MLRKLDVDEKSQMKDEEPIRFSIEYSRRLIGSMPLDQFAAMAENLGFDGLTVAGSRGPAADHLVFLAQAAAVTERLLLSTSVLVLPFVHPVLLAQDTATTDVVSDGRLVLGVGVGGERYQEFQALGVPLKERGVRANEAIDILKGLWQQPTFSYRGRIFNLENVSLNPRPIQKPHPPIWVGGRLGGKQTGPSGKSRHKSRMAAMHRAARYGDGWFPYLTEPETYRESVKQVKLFAKQYGRENVPFTWAHNLFWAVGNTYEEGLAAAAAGNAFGGHKEAFSAKYDIAGAPADCIKQVRQYIDAGVRHCICKPLLPAENLVEQMNRIAREIIPHFR